MPEGQIRTPEVPIVPPLEQLPTADQARLEKPTPAPHVERHPVEAVTPVAPVIPMQAVSHATASPAQLIQQVESIMVAGLETTYRQLDPPTQQHFKTVGEQTAKQISTLLQSASYQVKKIIDLLVTWLRIIPHVNRYFLEQEAKIKADRLINLTRHQST